MITASTLGAHSLSNPLSLGSCQETCSLLYREVHVARHWVLCLASHQGGKEVLSPQIHKDLRLVNNLVSELWSTDISFPRSTFSWPWQPQTKAWQQPYQIFASETPSSATLGFWPSSTEEIIQLCYFKMLSVRVICYAAKYNSLRPQGCSLLAKLERGWNRVSRREHGRW